MLEILQSMSFIIPLALWSAFWKGWALWIAGNRKEKNWFVLLFILNTAGILDIAYVLLRRNKKGKKA